MRLYCFRLYYVCMVCWFLLTPSCSVCRYAPFCKHLFIENFTDTRVNVVKITQSNSRLLQSDYEARAENELPVYVASHCLSTSAASH